MKKLLTILFILIAGSCFSQKPVMDTVRVTMLCSDTLRYDRWVPFENVFWQFGYLVTKKIWVEEAWRTYFPTGYEVKFICYLDEAKDPLPKNIVVWLYK